MGKIPTGTTGPGMAPNSSDPGELRPDAIPDPPPACRRLLQNCFSGRRGSSPQNIASHCVSPGYRTGGGHALTAWGFEYDPSDARYYTGVWVTDSDDNQTDLDYYSLRRGDGDRWFLNGYAGEDDWHIGGVQALGQIPEPGTLLLFGSAVAGLAAFRFRRKKRV